MNEKRLSVDHQNVSLITNKRTSLTSPDQTISTKDSFMSVEDWKTKKTEPKPFHFKTEERFGKYHESPKTPKPTYVEEYYSGSITIPQPFHLSESKKIQIYQDTPEKVEKVEKVIEFKGTPTIPKPFNLSQKSKSTPKSTEEIEKEELEKLRAQPFKARAVHPKILKGELLESVEVKSPTIPEPFKITPSKSQQSSREDTPQKKEKEFHFGLTNPETPPLSFRRKPKKDKEEDVSNLFPTLPPNFEVIKGLDIVKRKTNRKMNTSNESFKDLSITSPEPFYLESVERHKLNDRIFKENLRKEMEETQKQRCFKASPLPNLS